MATTYEPKNILITGATGFIGSHVAIRLVRTYPCYNVLVLDKMGYCSSLKNLDLSRHLPNFKFVDGDIASPGLVHRLLVDDSIDTVMHFAAQTQVDSSFGDCSFEFTKNNVHCTHVPLSSRLLPTNPYSASKAGAKMLVMAYGTSHRLPVIMTRGNNVYGPNQFPEKLIPKFVLLAMRGLPLPVYGNGSNTRSYLYCDDVADAFDVVLHKGEAGQVYNIGAAKERKAIEVARDICKILGVDAGKAVSFVEDRPFHDQRYFVDSGKLKKLGWSERTSWEEGLRKTVAWYAGNFGYWGDVGGALRGHHHDWMSSSSSSLESLDEDEAKECSSKEKRSNGELNSSK